MKKIYLFLFLIQLSLLSAQGFNYQSTVRNSNNSIAANTVVKFKFYIRQNSDSGTIIYTETHQTQTNNLGVVNLVIGQGTATVGNFSQINWTSATYYLGIEYNINSTCQWIPVSTGANGQVMSKCNGVYTWGSCPEYTNLVWSDEFNTNGAPDSTKWSYDIGNWGWGNGEAQNYTNRTNNAVVLDGNLKIIAKKESYGGSEYTSARLKTLNKFNIEQ